MSSFVLERAIVDAEFVSGEKVSPIQIENVFIFFFFFLN